MVELIVVVLIIGVLATIAIPMYNGYVNKAKITLAIGTLESMRLSLEAFNEEHNKYPSPPISFVTGLDNDGQRVFAQIFIGQLEKDLFSPPPPVYSLVGEVYTVTVRARDDQHTVLTLTQQEITR